MQYCSVAYKCTSIDSPLFLHVLNNINILTKHPQIKEKSIKIVREVSRPFKSE